MHARDDVQKQHGGLLQPRGKITASSALRKLLNEEKT